MAIDTVVFDIGGVLVDWQPHLAWIDELGDAGSRAFLARIRFDKINFACDAGARFGDAAEGLTDPQDARRLSQYVAQYGRTVPDKVAGTWEVLHDLRARDVPLHAITNWSAETWPEGVRVHPELGTVFATTIVSGDVGIVKPSVGIFRLFCDRAGVRPEQCVFIDDGVHNCLGARAAGMDAIHFTGADGLRADLADRGLL
ncbi:MAG: HAD family phosphatase [Pseudomonadota bacterium]